MNFSFSDEQRMLRDSVSRFVKQQYSFDQREVARQKEAGFDDKNWALFAELGWLMVPFSEKAGGLSGKAADVMIVMEELGKGLVVEPYFANTLLAGKLISELSNNSNSNAMLENMMVGEYQFSLAYCEPQSRYDLANVNTQAEVFDNEFVLNGHKSVVLNAAMADMLVVIARTSSFQTDKNGLSAILVDPQSPGVDIRCYPTVDGFQAADIYFSNVTVAKSNLLGNLDDAFPALEKTVDFATFGVCAEAIGMMEMLYKKTVEYTKERQQFGKPLASFQALQHRMADMFIEYEQAKSAVLMAAMELDSTQGFAPKEVSAAKSRVGKAARLIGQEAVQLHGGMGVTDELDIGHYFKRLTAIQFVLGSTDFHTQRYASLCR